MKKTKLKSGGFSLVELLIVITIIGVLSTIILSSVSNSRARAYDSKIKQLLGSFRTAAEMYFTNHGRYNETEGVEISDCSTGMFNDVNAADGSPGLYIDPANFPTFSEIRCDSNDSSYAVKASLSAGSGATGAYWCIDNKGASRSTQEAIGDPVTICP